MRIAIVAPGAVGGYFGVLLAKSGENVGALARGPHLYAIAEHGLVQPVRCRVLPHEILDAVGLHVISRPSAGAVDVFGDRRHGARRCPALLPRGPQRARYFADIRSAMVSRWNAEC